MLTKISEFLIQTPLGALSKLQTPISYEAPSDFQAEKRKIKCDE